MTRSDLEQMVRWRLPGHEQLKLYSDGSASGGNMSSGFVVRDERGSLIHGQAEIGDEGTTILAEASAILMAIKWIVRWDIWRPCME